MDTIYDIIIVGAGPSGLTLATLLSSNSDYKVLIVDTEKDLGGCHRVRRDQGNLFSEHGPRVYSNSYTSFNKILGIMNLKFEDLFVPYAYSTQSIAYNTTISKLNSMDILKFALAFLRMVVSKPFKSYGKNINLSDWLKENNYLESSTLVVDSLCRLIDGGGIAKFSLYKFLQVANIQAFYQLYQPKLPNDQGLFKLWKEYLEAKGVTFLLNTKIIDLYVGINKAIENNIHEIKYLVAQIGGKDSTDLRSLTAEKYVFAIPPIQLKELLDNLTQTSISTTLPTIDSSMFFGKDFSQFALETEYTKYLCMTFHWNKDSLITFNKKYNSPMDSEYQLVYITVSDYMNLDSTVISVAVTNVNAVSTRNNKSAKDCTKDELIEEVYLQLNEILQFSKKYNKVVVSSGNGIDTAFIDTHKWHEIPFKSTNFTNLFTLGTHNGKSSYPATTLESAVENSIEFYNTHLTNVPFNVGFRYTLTHLVIVILLVVLILVFKIVFK